MKKHRFALTFLMIFLVALFASCSPDVGTPEDNTNYGKEPWPNLENFYGRIFYLMQDNESSEGQFKVGTVEITNDGDVIIKDNNGNSLIPGFESLKEMYDVATYRVHTGSGINGFALLFRTYPKDTFFAIDTENMKAAIATTDTRDYNYTIVETTPSNN